MQVAFFMRSQLNNRTKLWLLMLGAGLATLAAFIIGVLFNREYWDSIFDGIAIFLTVKLMFDLVVLKRKRMQEKRKNNPPVLS